MSLKNLLYSLCALGLVVGAAISRTTNKIESSSRAPASLKTVKFQPQKLQISKPRQDVEVQLEVVDGFPSNNNEAAIIRAHIQADQITKESIDYQWILPEGTQLVRGSMYGLLQGVTPEQEVVLDIEVLGFSSEGMPRNILFETSSQRKDSIFGSSTVLSSHPTRSDLSISFRPTKNELEREGGVQSKALSLEENHDSLSKSRRPASKNVHY